MLYAWRFVLIWSSLCDLVGFVLVFSYCFGMVLCYLFNSVVIQRWVLYFYIKWFIWLAVLLFSLFSVLFWLLLLLNCWFVGVFMVLCLVCGYLMFTVGCGLEIKLRLDVCLLRLGICWCAGVVEVLVMCLCCCGLLLLGFEFVVGSFVCFRFGCFWVGCLLVVVCVLIVCCVGFLVCWLLFNSVVYILSFVVVFDYCLW